MNDEWNDVRENMTNYRLECGTMIKKCVVTNLISMEFFFTTDYPSWLEKNKDFFWSKFSISDDDTVEQIKSNQIKLM